MLDSRVERTIKKVSSKSKDVVEVIKSFNLDAPFEDQIGKFQTCSLYLSNIQTIQKKSNDKNEPPTAENENEISDLGESDVKDFLHHKILPRQLSQNPKKIDWYQDCLSLFTQDIQEKGNDEFSKEEVNYNEEEDEENVLNNAVEWKESFNSKCDDLLKIWSTVENELDKNENEMEVEEEDMDLIRYVTAPRKEKAEKKRIDVVNLVGGDPVYLGEANEVGNLINQNYFQLGFPGRRK